MSQQSLSSNLRTSLINGGFTGDLVIPGDPDYAASLVRFAKNATRKATLVAFAKCAHDVATVIKFVNAHPSPSGTRIPIVVRGGGHSPSGTSSTEDGIVIDLSRHLNSVRIDGDKKLGYVGGGATWGAVDKEAIRYGLATTGGTVNHTGVGG
jgi:FAD/FMN-containing dehydrogenase